MTVRRVSGRELGLVFLLALGIFTVRLGDATLIDPWETHYGEVARRILADDDWIKLSWEAEGFRSKPALTPWLIAASLRLHGIASDGGFSGELAVHPWTTWAVRLPFAIFGAFGVAALWLAAARLASRRVAWFAAGVLSTIPMWTFVARQAITDMPMAATAAGSLAFLLLAVHDGERPVSRWGDRAFWLVLLAWVLPQLFFVTRSLYRGAPLGPGMAVEQPHLVFLLPFLGLLGLLAVLHRWPRRRTARHTYLYAAYALAGLSILGKGPPGVAVVTLTGLAYVVITGRYRLLLRLRLLDGIVIVLLVAAPWHLAMALRDGTPFVSEYFGQHWLARATGGVHEVNAAGSETFRYFFEQLAIGLGPWLVVVPAAFAHALGRRGGASVRDRVRSTAVLWSVVGFAFFTIVETKFHHYVLPALPGVALVVAFWADDLWADALWAGRASRIGAVAILGGVVQLLVLASVAASPDQLIELFTYRYDRPWPEDVDVSVPLVVVGGTATVLAVAIAIVRVRRLGLIGLAALGLVVAVAGVPGYMARAAPHWGQRSLIRSYYDARALHGATLRYAGHRALADDLGPLSSGGTVRIATAVGHDTAVGDPFRLTIEAVGAEPVEVEGRIAAVERAAVVVEAAAESAPLAALVAGGRGRQRFDGDGPVVVVDAERLIAWQLYWRGETFWTADEINGPVPEMHSELRAAGAAPLRQYLARFCDEEQTWFVITERQRVEALRGALPDPSSRATLRIVDDSSNKFVLAAFDAGAGTTVADM